MKMFYRFLIFSLTVLLAASAFGAPCFKDEASQKAYEQKTLDEESANQITQCIKNNWAKGELKDFEKEASSIRKAKEVPVVQQELFTVFSSTTNPQNAFTALSTIIDGGASVTQQQQNILLSALTLQTQEYKKILATIALADFGLIDSSYSDYLIPALNAEDEILKAYASAAYNLLIPKMQDKYLDAVITLYGFNKPFALRAFIATGTDQKTLCGHLKEAFLSPLSARRLSAIEWAADLKNKKVLEALGKMPEQYNDTSTISAAAFALSKNYAQMQPMLEKSLKKNPSSNAATTAVMAYAFLGNPSFKYIEDCLKQGNTNQKANAARVISSVAGLLKGNQGGYENPAFERQKLLQLIGPLGKAENANKEDSFTPYFEAASKELYSLLNQN